MDNHDSRLLEELVAEALDRLEQDGPGALESFYASHPGSEDALRERVEWLLETGLAGPPEQAPGDYPERLGDFRLIEPIGQGGMGVVYRAEQLSLGREVALKLVRPEHLYFPGALERFEQEVTTIAGLAHPGIVPVYAVGQEQGIPFFAMEHVRGVSLAQVIAHLEPRPARELSGADLQAALEQLAPQPKGDHQPLEANSMLKGPWPLVCARIVREVAEALEHAHRRGVLHRDVKPSNIMLTPGGRVMLLDFGLSSSESVDQRRTKTGQQVGTLAYMAPEQLRGERELNARTDVFGLGVVLYELLALRLPFDASSAATRMAASDQPLPTDLRKQDPRVSWELETVVQTASDPDATRRYATAADLGRDLGNVLQNRPIAARRSGLLLRARRWVQRNPAGALAALVAVVAPTGFAVQEYRANRALSAKSEALSNSNAALEQSNQALEQSNTALEGSNRALSEALDDAREQRQVAEDARRRSDAHFERAYEAVELMLGRVGGEVLRDVPHMDLLRRDLLLDALRLQEELFAEAETSWAQPLLYARTLRRAASLRIELGQIPEAIEVLERQAGLLDELIGKTPNWRLALERAEIEFHHAQVALNQRDFEAAEARARDAIERADQLLLSNRDLSIALMRARTFILLAESLSITGNLDQAREELEPVVDELRQLVERDRSDRRRRTLLARSLRVLAGYPESQVLNWDVGFDAGEAEPYLEEAFALFEDLVDEEPDNPHTLRYLADTAQALGGTRAGLGRVRESEAPYRRSLDAFERLERDYPAKPAYTDGLASALLNLGTAACYRGDFTSGAALYERSVEAFEALHLEHPEQPNYQRRAFMALSLLGKTLSTIGADREQSEAVLTRAVELGSPLAAEDPDPNLHNLVAWSIAVLNNGRLVANDAVGLSEGARLYLAINPTPIEQAYAAQYLATAVGIGQASGIAAPQLAVWTEEALDLLDSAAGNAPKSAELHRELLDPRLSPLRDNERYLGLLDLLGIAPGN